MIYSYLLHGSDVTTSSNCSENISFVSFFSAQFENLNDVNKHEQTMPSYLLSVNFFWYKAINVIKNILQLTKYHLVPLREVKEFLRLSAYPQSLLGSKIAQMTKEGINSGKAIAHYTGIIFNHPPVHPRGFAPKFLPPPWGFCILAFAQGWGYVGIALSRGGHLSTNDFYHFWNFHYNGKNWRLTTLWG